ncbi:30S ribosomal protein S4e [Ignicoccus hospitalis]|uniref:Small ribosomal subunit protein eS4 n=1 Tax=Ignicoccus hospitalis (strain KIN4/I / DSM 18386 / JCM 14125) TaxID=453591 RepID=RS4E_IGNH4|nr:30S ribosomal protein S4e [Ignicoccus hospitalis]A8ACD4.1 RecName: Full=Small ribosomal subunit protein eS4; AltName: Full=30S ribosomal protein S4e [Ignicoccus hospitalis KIN4/I]ABU82586.1 SSU ribosomal protein S4E [Ignicoccus hospitalis KIN4/I]HIH90751.1 30S ribosomal protein S4e [Desulfurococcaceae archaeon]
MARVGGGKRHLKRLAAPAFWPIHRKEAVWAVKPRPGPHPIEESIPLLILVRDVLGYAETSREARKLIAEGRIKVDGRVRKDYKFPVGAMDVIEIVGADEYYRMIPYPVKYLVPMRIDAEEAKKKICRIENKVTVKGGHVQLNLHDGRNVLIRVEDPRNPVEAQEYKTLGGLLITVPEQEILDYVPFEEGVIAIVKSGRNVGRVGRIEEIVKGMGRKKTLVKMRDVHDEVFYTVAEYVFPIGKEEPLIKLPEGAWK